MRTRQRRAIHCPNASDIQAVENPVEQRRIAPRACSVEGLENAVLKNVRFVQFDGIPQLRTLVSHVADLQRQILRELALNRKIDVVAVLNNAIISKSTKRSRAIG